MATDITRPAIEIPPLRVGDRLNREEFELRWETTPALKRAELINGVVHMPPVSVGHGTPHFDVIVWLGYYRTQTPGVEGCAETSLRLDDENEPQPDALLRIVHGGRSHVDADGYLDTGPELVCEVARSSISTDLGGKLELYRRFGVPEYIVWRVIDQQVDWFILRDGTYQRLRVSPDGIMRSEVFPGLWLDPAALISGDAARLIAVAQLGHGSPEHAAFVQKLQKRVH